MEEELAYIDSFFNNELNERERQEFEKRCETDNTFAELVAFYVKTKYGFTQLNKQQRKAEFEKLRSKHSPSIVIRSYTYWLAAALVICSCVLGWWLWSKPDLEQLADNYIQENFVTISSTMSSDEDSLKLAIGLFNKGELAKSSIIFDRLALKNNPEAIKYAGIAYLRLQNYTTAIERFELLKKQNLLSNAGTFYHAIALLKRKENDDLRVAKRLLQKVKDQKFEGWQEVEKWGL